jgi:hypothetical protein
MRFTSARDYETMVRINQELINEVIDIKVVIYNVNQTLSKTNSYGEAPKKTYFQGVEIPCLFKREHQSNNAEMQTVSTEQQAEFQFLRQECVDREIYPEAGDIIDFGNNYYEIDVANENQLIAGQTTYNHSIVCTAHLTRNTAIQLEKPSL